MPTRPAPTNTAQPSPAFENKLVSRQTLAERAAALPRPIVLTNGVFDLLHRGHVTYLAQARALGASLVVALNADSSVRQLGKGDERPINGQDDRAAVLAALESVSLVTIFEEKVPLPVIDLVRPDIYVKGGDYAIDTLPETAAVNAYGGHALAIPFMHDRSTTAVVKKLSAGAHGGARGTGGGTGGGGGGGTGSDNGGSSSNGEGVGVGAGDGGNGGGE